MKTAISVALLLMLCGCGSKRPPAPQGTHWSGIFTIGDELYCDADGKKIASVVNGQATVFTPSKVPIGLFEHNQDALAYTAKYARCEQGSEYER